MNNEVRSLTEDEWPLWDDFVDESLQGTIFHKSFWLKASGVRFAIYGYFRGEELYAGICLSYRVRFGLKEASRPATTPYSGILFKELDAKYVSELSAKKKASQEIVQRLKNDFNIVRIRGLPGSVDLQPFIWEGFSINVQYTYIIRLDKTLEDIWDAMEEVRRRNIRKAKKDGITIIQSDDFNQTFNLVEKTFVRQNMSSSNSRVVYSYNEALAQRGQCKSFLAKNKNGEYMAAAYIVWDRRRSYYLLGGYDSEKSHYGASALALWEAIKFSKQELALEEFDFEGSMIPRFERFFRGFGGQLTVRYSTTWVRPSYRIPFFVMKTFGRIFARLRL